MRYARAGDKGGILALTYSMPFRAAGKRHDWHTVGAPDPATLKRGTIVVFSVTYAEPVSLRLPDRTSRPFNDATAEFAVPVRRVP